jgi:transcriptional regulator with XRE-family HTH domain
MKDLDIKKIRINAGLTQTEFAERLGVGMRTIQKYERDGDVPEYMIKLINYEFNSDYSSVVSEPFTPYRSTDNLEQEIILLKKMIDLKEKDNLCWFLMVGLKIILS